MYVELQPIPLQSRHVLENLFPYYIYDMSEFMGWNPNESGVFFYDNANFDKYWSEDSHHPFFITVDGTIAGFVLIRKYPQDLSLYDIEQFFVLRKYKGQGVGTQALQKVVTHFPGNWQVRVMLENNAGLSFWKSAIGQLSKDYQYSKSIDVDLTMHFFHFEAGGS